MTEFTEQKTSESPITVEANPAGEATGTFYVFPPASGSLSPTIPWEVPLFFG